LQVQRAKFIDAEDPPVERRVIIQVEDAGHLRGEVRVAAGLPGFAACQLISASRSTRLIVSVETGSR